MVSPTTTVLPYHHKGKTPFLFIWSWLRARVFQKCKPIWIFGSLLGIGLIAFLIHRVVATTLTTKAWEAAPINYMERQCPAVSYPTIVNKPKICMTTLTDQQQADWLQRLLKWRQFDNLLAMTWPNKKAYCDKHGYHLVDSSPYLDNSRPPSWSKIVAARRLLVEEKCDWVIWLDADTVIMNSLKKLEDLLPEEHDFVVTKQKSRSYNAGAWIIKNTPWAIQFLDTWWSMDEYVRVKGLSVSGDNDALFHFLTERMPVDEFTKHIVVPPRCSFNSVTKWVSSEEAKKYQNNPELVKKEDWCQHEEYYHKGDLIAHVAGKSGSSRNEIFGTRHLLMLSSSSFITGRNNKIDTTEELLRHAT